VTDWRHLVDPIVGASKYETYGGNTLITVNTEVSTDRPLGIDQYSAFYQKYEVAASKITVTIVNGNNIPLTCTLVPQHTTGAFIAEDGSELPYSKSFVLTNGVTSSAGVRTFSHYFSYAKMVGARS